MRILNHDLIIRIYLKIVLRVNFCYLLNVAYIGIFKPTNDFRAVILWSEKNNAVSN